MTISISSAVLAQLLRDAAVEPDREVCGLLFGTHDRIAAALSCSNVAADPARSFEIDPAALLAAHRRARTGGAAVIGHYHSHPTGIAGPSQRDAAQSMGDGAIWLIVAGGAARGWRSITAGAFVEDDIILI